MEKLSEPTIQPKSAMGAAEWSLLLLLALVWGASFFFQKKVLRELGPYTMVFGRLALAALALNSVSVLMRYRFSALRPHWPGMILMAAFNNALPFCLFGWSQTRIASGLAAIFNATAPLFTVLFAHLFTRDERLTTRKGFGVMAGLIGVIFIIGPDVLRGPRGSLMGQLACVLAANSYALCAIYSRRFKANPPILLAGVQIGIAALMVLPIALLVEHPWKARVSMPTTWLALFALGLLSTGLAYAIWFRLIATAGATNTVLVTFLIPITALVLGAVFLSERIQPRALMGFGCIILGLAIIDGRILRAVLARKPTVRVPERAPQAGRLT